MNKIVNFVFINLALSCCELNIELVYRKVAERNCLRGESYRCVKRGPSICRSFKLNHHDMAAKGLSVGQFN